MAATSAPKRLFFLPADSAVTRLSSLNCPDQDCARAFHSKWALQKHGSKCIGKANKNNHARIKSVFQYSTAKRHLPPQAKAVQKRDEARLNKLIHGKDETLPVNVSEVIFLSSDEDTESNVIQESVRNIISGLEDCDMLSEYDTDQEAVLDSLKSRRRRVLFSSSESEELSRQFSLLGLPEVITPRSNNTAELLLPLRTTGDPDQKQKFNQRWMSNDNNVVTSSDEDNDDMMLTASGSGSGSNYQSFSDFAPSGNKGGGDDPPRDGYGGNRKRTNTTEPELSPPKKKRTSTTPQQEKNKKNKRKSRSDQDEPNRAGGTKMTTPPSDSNMVIDLVNDDDMQDTENILPDD